MRRFLWIAFLIVGVGAGCDSNKSVDPKVPGGTPDANGKRLGRQPSTGTPGEAPPPKPQDTKAKTSASPN